MDHLFEFVDKVLCLALVELRTRGTDLYTMALYHDHESHALSVCADTRESSRAQVLSTNKYNRKYFWPAIDEGDLENAGLWCANVGRSLSLGDFAYVNLCRSDLNPAWKGEPLYLSMIRSLRAYESEIVRLSSSPQDVLLCSSGPQSEVAFWWTPAS